MNHLKSLTPTWDSTVISGQSEISTNLKNSLFYAEETSWVPIDLLITRLNFELLITKGGEGVPNVDELLSLKSQSDFLKLITSKISDPKNFDAFELILHTISIQSYVLARGYILESGFQLNEEHIDAYSKELERSVQLDEFPFRQPLNPIDIVQIAPILLKNWTTTKISFIEAVNAEIKNGIWTPYSLSKELIMALHRTQILPDISDLELSDLKDLQTQIKDELDPMRAELLRMTEDLRKMAGADMSEENIAREAENLIITRVEPVLIEAAAHIKSEMNNIKVLGFVGLGFLFPDKGIYGAVKEAVNLASETLSDLNQPKPPKATARLSMEMRAGLEKNKCLKSMIE